MDDNIVDFTGGTKLNIPAEKILQGAAEADLDEVVILGYRKDGVGYFASSMSDAAAILWLVENFKKSLLEDE